MDASYWLRVVAEGVLRLLLDRVQAIPRLSRKGSQQLACDLGYLGKILAAMGMEIEELNPVAACALRLLGAADEAEVRDLDQQGALTCSDEEAVYVLNTLLKIRDLNIQLESLEE